VLERVQRVGDADLGTDDLPIKGVDPSSGELRWYLDAEACGAESESPKR